MCDKAGNAGELPFQVTAHSYFSCEVMREVSQLFQLGGDFKPRLCVWMYPLLMCYIFLPSYVPLSDNEKTDFRARELKSVYMDAVGQYLKLIFHKNYVNKYNLYGQVS